MTDRCVYRGEHIEQQTGPGRPSSYCGTACKRAAQSERQRIVRHLVDREGVLMDVRHAVERGSDYSISVPFGLVKPAVRLRELEADIATLRARLRSLLDD